MFDVITIGSATLDAFIETDEANIVSVCSQNTKKEFMSYPYGAKIEIDEFDFQTGGGGVNTATNFSNLGLNTSTIIKIGEEIQGQKIIETLEKYNVDMSNIVKSKKHKTGFSIILTSFQGDRTVLAHRGANAKLEKSDINFEAIKNSKWLYLAPLNGDSTKVLDELAEYAEKHGTNLAINLGTSSIKQGKKHLKNILKTAEVVIMNKDEISMLTETEVRPDTKEKKYSKEFIHPDIRKMMKDIHKAKSRVVIVTDGKNGAYAYDGETYYRCEEFPAKVVSTLGAGDAFSSTFVASLIKTKGDIKKSLLCASVEAAAVVEEFGAQKGFIEFDEIERRLKSHPNFTVKTMKSR